jgi:hypothetical protein
MLKSKEKSRFNSILESTNHRKPFFSKGLGFRVYGL